MNNGNKKSRSKIPLGIFYGFLLGFVMESFVVGILIGTLAAVVLDFKAIVENNDKEL